MLEVRGIHTYYGQSHILFDVSLALRKGEVVGLLGRNGAGKSTTMKSVCGMLHPREGRLLFEGEDVTGRKPFEMVRRGICYVPDDRRVFADLTVDDNLGIVHRRTGEWTRDRVYDLFPPLREIAGRRAGFLSGGEKAMLALGRALMSGPRLLLLDEPTEGLAPLIVRSLEEQILRLKEAGISMLLSEQNLKSSLKLIDRAYIIDNGRIR
ncbi:MAG: amino acid/amide transporter ATP-binding protein 2, family, partial [Deltaproteobacteria bacterium]|nr:amino acid/amide transporter ATP-binding protein 2, family [Deltaproteobacteria bacterium]